MCPQLDGVCYCLSNSCAIVFRHYRRFDYQTQIQDRQKPHPVISRRAVRRRHYRPRIKSQKTARSVVRELNPQPSEQLRPITIKTSASTETATAAYINSYVCHFFHPGEIYMTLTLTFGMSQDIVNISNTIHYVTFYLMGIIYVFLSVTISNICAVKMCMNLT